MSTFDDILSDPYFVKLDKELSKFNIFHATDMKNREIKHTKFLGYLLDPNESHQLGTQFLWQFLRKIVAAGIENIDLINLNLQFAKVNIEYRLAKNRLDLLLEIPKGNNSLIIAIENKIKAKQGDRQLLAYKEKINKNFQKDQEIKLIYLTVDEEPPRDNDWINLTYGDTVIPALKELLATSEETLSSYLRFILQDYIEIIERDEDKLNAEFEIYKLIDNEIKNKIRDMTKEPDALEDKKKLQILYPRAFEYIKNFDDDIRLKALDKFINSIGQRNDGPLYLDLESSNRSYLRFSAWTPAVQKFLTDGICSAPTRRWVDSRRNLAFEINLREGKNNSAYASTKIVLGPTNENFNLRSDICNEIASSISNAAEPKIGNKRTNKINSSYTTAIKTITESKELKSWKDLEEWIEKEIKKFSDGAEYFNYIDEVNKGIKNFVRSRKKKLLELGVSSEILNSFEN